MDDEPKWTFKIAQNLAQSLRTIGHPSGQDVIDATALDLTTWCKGAILDGTIWQPEEQAEWLVTHVRYGPSAWVAGWLNCGGTAALHAVFLAKFPPPKVPEAKNLSPEQLIAKGLISERCGVCGDELYLGKPPNMTYCTACPQGRHLARWNGEAALHRLNCQPAKRKSAPVPIDGGFRRPAQVRMTPAVMARALADEMRRKREQLERTGME